MASTAHGVIHAMHPQPFLRCPWQSKLVVFTCVKGRSPQGHGPGGKTMSDTQDLLDALASIFDAGARACRSTPFNNQRALEAETLQVMADEARYQSQLIDRRHD